MAVADKYPPNFLSFWSSYPRKTNKPAAFKAWQKLGMELDLFAAKDAVANLEARTKCGWWPADKTKIPHPSSWIHGMRWEDENWQQDVPDYERQTTTPEAIENRVQKKVDKRVTPWQEAALNRAYLSYSVRATLSKNMLDVEGTGRAMQIRDEILDAAAMADRIAAIEAGTKTEHEVSRELVAVYLARMDREFGLSLAKRVMGGSARARQRALTYGRRPT